jgi:hypothetical protein
MLTLMMEQTLRSMTKRKRFGASCAPRKRKPLQRRVVVELIKRRKVSPMNWSWKEVG